MIVDFDSAIKYLLELGYKEHKGRYSAIGGLYFGKGRNCKDREELFFKDVSEMLEYINSGELL